MTTTELITELKKLPPDAEVGYVWDGCVRSDVQLVWLTHDGRVALSDENQYVQDDDDKPEHAALRDGPFWATKESIKP